MEWRQQFKLNEYIYMHSAIKKYLMNISILIVILIALKNICSNFFIFFIRIYIFFHGLHYYRLIERILDILF